MRKAVGLVAAVVCVSMAASSLAAKGQQRTVWAGVFTEEQAAQGAAVYRTQCVACHGELLTGGEQVPALTGVTFGATWEGLPLADLFERMRKTMPPGKSGAVTRAEYAGVLAYVLKMNGMPAGSTPLPADASLLGAILFRSHQP
jgi:mono/diheme cytochrome c family protein